MSQSKASKEVVEKITEVLNRSKDLNASIDSIQKQIRELFKQREAKRKEQEKLTLEKMQEEKLKATKVKEEDSVQIAKEKSEAVKPIEKEKSQELVIDKKPDLTSETKVEAELKPVFDKKVEKQKEEPKESASENKPKAKEAENKKEAKEPEWKTVVLGNISDFQHNKPAKKYPKGKVVLNQSSNQRENRYQNNNTNNNSGNRYNNSNNRNDQNRYNNTLNIANSFIPETKQVDKSKKKSNNNNSQFEEKKVANKKSLIRKGLIVDNRMYDFDLDNENYKVRKNKKKQEKEKIEQKIEHAVVTQEVFSIKHLSEKIGQQATSIVKKLFELDQIVNINDDISFETAELIAADFGTTLELKLEKTAEDVFQEAVNITYDESDLEKRPPVVTIMGHVDHGKTSLLDYIRNAHVARGEAGGITQHIGAYSIKVNGEQITFLDTPGHEAFTTMRRRGAMVTDIAIIVVAADDGIMPQTVEAISHAKEAGVSIIVAINKMDKETKNVEAIKTQLASHDLVPEEWGGDTIICPVSAKTGMGVDDLLNSILLIAEIKEFKSSFKSNAQGSIIEAKIDKGSGPIATVLIKDGCMKVGDNFVAGTTTGKVRAMFDPQRKPVKKAYPSDPVLVLGFSEVPNAGDQLMVLDDEKIVKQVAQERIAKNRNDMEKSNNARTLEDIFKNVKKEGDRLLSVIIKADVQGSVEAVRQALEKIEVNDEEGKINVKVVHSAVGAINESDVSLADTSESIILAFNVRPDQKAKELAERTKIEIRTYSVIYDMINEITDAMNGLLHPKFIEEVLGHAEVRDTFKITGVGTIAGSYVTDGKIVRNKKVRLLRDNIVIYDGLLSSLKRVKDDVKEVNTGYECGIGIKDYNDIKVGDVIEVYSIEEKKANE